MSRGRQVTPPGHELAVWQTTIEATAVVNVAGLAGNVVSDDGSLGLVVLSAHPDDETIGAGRLVSQWSRTLGWSVAVLATAGEACVDHVGVRPTDLAARRLAEWRAATAILGVSGTINLDLSDGQLEASEPQLEQRLRSVLESTAGIRVVAAPWRHDPHPDHRAVGRAAARLCAELCIALVEYPVWMTFWTGPPVRRNNRLLRVEVDQRADVDHARALALFASQLEPLGPDLDPVVPAPMLDHHGQQLLLMPNGPRP